MVAAPFGQRVFVELTSLADCSAFGPLRPTLCGQRTRPGRPLDVGRSTCSVKSELECSFCQRGVRYRSSVRAPDLAFCRRRLRGDDADINSLAFGPLCGFPRRWRAVLCLKAGGTSRLSRARSIAWTKGYRSACTQNGRGRCALAHFAAHEVFLRSSYNSIQTTLCLLKFLETLIYLRHFGLLMFSQKRWTVIIYLSEHDGGLYPNVLLYIRYC